MIYDDIHIYETLFVVGLNGKYGLTDKDGNVLIPAEYDWMGNGFEYEDNTLMIVGKKGGFYEYINRKGEKFDKKEK